MGGLPKKQKFHIFIGTDGWYLPNKQGRLIGIRTCICFPGICSFVSVLSKSGGGRGGGGHTADNVPASSA